jgi:hypothetical protein
MVVGSRCVTSTHLFGAVVEGGVECEPCSLEARLDGAFGDMQLVGDRRDGELANEVQNGDLALATRQSGEGFAYVD